jgi:hypothetical protein
MLLDDDDDDDDDGKSRNSSVGIVMSEGLGGQNSIPFRGKRIFSTPQLTDRLWGPPSLLLNRYRGVFPRR